MQNHPGSSSASIPVPVPGYPLSPGCWPRAGAALVSPPAARPCPLSPSRVAGAVCAPPTALLDCWKLSRKEAVFPLALPGGTVTSGGCHGGHLPGTNTSCCAGCFPRVQWPWSVWLCGDTEPSSPEEEEEAALGYSRALDLVPPPKGLGGKLGEPGGLCLAPGSLHGVPAALGLQTCPLSLSWAVSLWFHWWVFFKLVLFAFFLPQTVSMPFCGFK